MGIRPPTAADQTEFLALAHTSAEFLRPWINPPLTVEQYETYLTRRQANQDGGGFVCERRSGQIVGVINMSNIVRGYFQSAYLGYWVGAPFAGRGWMTEALQLVVRHAFDEMKLHRLEANIQPDNLRSIALVRRCGFKKEGYSPRYLQIFGVWRDHERWAVLADEGNGSQQHMAGE